MRLRFERTFPIIGCSDGRSFPGDVESLNTLVHGVINLLLNRQVKIFLRVPKSSNWKSVKVLSVDSIVFLHLSVFVQIHSRKYIHLVWQFVAESVVNLGADVNVFSG